VPPEPGETVKVEVVIATAGRSALLERTLSSVSECRLPDGFAGVLVVENGSRGIAEDVVRRTTSSLKARYLFEPVANKSRALNVALTHTSGSLIVFLDDDVRTDRELLALYAEAARTAGSGRFFGGAVVAEYEQPPPEWLVTFLPASARGLRAGNLSPDLSRRWFLGFNWAAFADDLREVGGFDERFGPGSISGGVGDETDVQARLRRAGMMPEFVPDAIVHHWVPRERCSPEWALRRAYANSVHAALVAEHPQALLWRLTRKCVRSQARRFSGDPAARFRARASFERWRGAIRGAGLRRTFPAHRRMERLL